jgi:glucose-1-phosphate thymidylyltransferase
MGDSSICRKGIILAGGSGTRLHPITRVVNKHLLPVYDKPMIYHPLSTLMLAGIQDILVITNPSDVDDFQALLGDGADIGIRISVVAQPEPNGLATAFIVGREFIGDQSVALCLGDNIFYGHGFHRILTDAANDVQGARIFSYPVKDPQRFGIVELDDQGQVVSLEEKPQHPKSQLAVVGLYFYDNQVVDIAAGLKPSARGELEITDVNKAYLERQQLQCKRLGRGFAWLDTGTHRSLMQAAAFMESIESRQGLRPASIEEIAWRKGFINTDQLRVLADQQANEYGEYLKGVSQESG